MNSSWPLVPTDGSLVDAGLLLAVIIDSSYRAGIARDLQSDC
jgi:hypothetical protein